MKPGRRTLLRGAGGLLLAGLAGRAAVAREPPAVIRMRTGDGGIHARFDPVGLLVAPGRRIRWVIESDVHTTTAYHPDNDGHALRIPEGAAPWDSGYLVEPGASFELVLTLPGVYDYFCRPHELAGMVGRIVVGRPGDGPGSADWQGVPPAARAVFPPVERILREGVVPA